MRAGIGIIASSRSGYDSDAQAYFTTTGITDTTEKNATNQFVLDLKGYSLWTSCYQILPLCWNDATKNKYDLKGSYTATMFGGITHASRYVTGNGTTGYIATGVNDNDVSSLNSFGVSFWCNTNSQENIYCYGSFDGIAKYNVVNPRNTLNEARAIIHDDAAGDYIVTNTNSQGFFTFQRTSSTNKNVYKSGILIDSMTATSTSKVNLENHFLKVNGIASYSSRAYQLLIQHSAFDATEDANLNTCINTFRTNLGL